MSANRKQELEEQFVGGASFRVARAPPLSPHLAELARPVSQQQRRALVGEAPDNRPIRVIVAGTGEPSLPELVVAGNVEPERTRLRPRDRRLVDAEIGAYELLVGA